MTETHPVDADVHSGNTPPHLEELHAAMTEVVPMLDLDPAEAEQAVADYVTRRIAGLSPQDPSNPIGHAYGGTTTFIDAQTQMIGSGLTDRPYVMDDPSAYEPGFPTMRQTYTNLQERMSPERAYLNAVVSAANYGQARYFESYVGDVAAKSWVTVDIIDDDRPEISSVADLKHVAVCQERAGVAHNTLWIFGVESEYVAGYLAVSQEDGGGSEPHAYIIGTAVDGTKFIFDPTNPVTYRDEEGRIVAITPAVYKLQPGVDQQTVQLREYGVVDGQAKPTGTRELTYYFNGARP